MQDMLKLLVGFLPWIAFGALAGPSLVRLEVAVAVAFLLTLAVSYSQLRRGVILAWGSALFFGANIILVIVLKNVWVMRHMDILAHMTLAAIAWGSLAMGRPFVLQFARESAPREKWDDPNFIASCRKLTVVWSALFLCGVFIALAKSMKIGGPEWAYGVLSTSMPVLGMVYTEWYKKQKRRLGEQAALSKS